jgi:hypothetical protein
MKVYKIIVNTLQGNEKYFCCWKMGGIYHIRLVILPSESIYYTEDELPFIKNVLEKNEKIQMKSFEVLEVQSKLKVK